MCGRARCTLRADGFSRACNLNARPVRHLNMDRYRPSYNVAPGFNVPVVRREDEGDGVVLHCMKWGLVPGFTKKTEKIDHFRMFNARSESIREKASFRRLIPKNRCLVSVEGFYEWKKDGSKKQPYYVHFEDGRPLVFAALFDSWKSSEGEILYTFTIITTSASSSLEWLHDRMPVVLGNKESTDCWLNDSSLSNLDSILQPYEGKDLAWYPVTTSMGKLSFDGPDCIKEIQVKTEETKSITQFFSKKGGPQEPKLGRPTTKEGPVETTEPKNVKEESGSWMSLECTKMKDKQGEYSLRESMKEEDEREDDHHLVTKNDDSDYTSNISTISPKAIHNITVKQDHAEPFAKETGRQHTSPVRKRSKTANDNQKTLFSYFGKS